MWSALVKLINETQPAGAAILAASLAVILFVAARIAEMVVAWRRHRALRRRIAIGLFKEIRENVACVGRCLDEKPHPGELREKVKADRNLRPLIVPEETTQFYNSVAASLPEIKEAECLLAVSRFYEKMRHQFAIIAAFEGAAFATVSVEARANAVDELWICFRQVEKEGLKALYELQLAHPRRWFDGLK